MINKSKIENAMKERNINNKTLAELVGVSPSMITRYLNGDSEMSVTTLCKIAANLRVSLDSICGIEAPGTMTMTGLTHEQASIIQNLKTAFVNHNIAIKKNLSSEQYELLGQIVAEFSK